MTGGAIVDVARHGLFGFRWCSRHAGSAAAVAISVAVFATFAFESVTFARMVVAEAAMIPPDRGDLGAAYLRFERAVAKAPRDPAARRAANLAFDGLTADFFAGRFDRALLKLAEIEGDLAREPVDAPARLERAYLASTRFEISPRLVAVSQATTFEIRMVPLMDRAKSVDAAEGVTREAADSVQPVKSIVLKQGVREVAVTVPTDASQPVVAKVDPPFLEGSIDVCARFDALGDVSIGRISVLVSDPATTRDALQARIDALAAAPKGDATSVDPSTLATLRARYELAFGTFDRAKSADLLADPSALVRDLTMELARAEEGSRPYRRAGDLWRVVRVLGTEMPVRQFVPEGELPFPLIVAFHGAGGDENLFFDGYGGGRLLEIARARGVAVICPPTIPFGVSPNVLPKFLEEIAADIPFDPTRVGLVGHSLGAVTATRLAVLRPESTNGVVGIAGFADLARKVEAAPRRIYLAELDPLFPLEPTRASVESAKSRGDDIECIEVANEGHTLVVGEVLDQAVAWLLARTPRAIARNAPTQSAPTTAPMKTDGPPPSENTVKPSAGPRK